MRAPRQLVVFGDSGVVGWGDREGGGWCERLRRHWMGLPDAPLIYGLGVRGDGLESVSRRWEQEWSCRGELRRQQPEAVMVSVGLNDTARVGRCDGRQPLDAQAFRFGFEQLLRSIQPRATVFVLGLTPVDEQAMPFAECLWYGNRDVAVHEAQIEEACLEVDVPFLSLHAAMQAEPEWLRWLEPDGIHLNAMGHAWIEQRLRFWTALQRWAGLDMWGGKHVPTQSSAPGSVARIAR